MFWIVVYLLAVLALLFLPGFALLTLRPLPERVATAILPLPGLLLLVFHGLLVWVLRVGIHSHLAPRLFTTICAVAVAVSVWQLAIRRRPFPPLHLLALTLYACVVVASTCYSFLDIDVPVEAFRQTCWRSRMVASPPDNEIPYQTGAFFLHGHSGRQDCGYFGEWSVATRGPLMGFANAALLNILRQAPEDPPWPDRDWPIDRQGFFAARLLGIATNAWVILAAPLLLTSLGANRSAVRFTLGWLCLAPVFLVNVVFLWPKLLATYFLILALVDLVGGRSGWRVTFWWALAYLSHPVAMLLLPALALFYARKHTARDTGLTVRRAASSAALFLSLALLWILPWLLYKAYLHQPNRFLLYVLGDGNGVQRAVSPLSWLNCRYLNFTRTLVPFNFFLGPDMHDWAGETLSEPVRWAVQYAQTLPGELGLFLCLPAYWYVLKANGSGLRSFRTVMLGVPFLTMLILWGFSPDGLGRNTLQPLTVLLLVFVGGQIERVHRGWRLALIAVSIETLYVMFGCLPADRSFAGFPLDVRNLLMYAGIAGSFLVVLCCALRADPDAKSVKSVCAADDDSAIPSDMNVSILRRPLYRPDARMGPCPQATIDSKSLRQRLLSSTTTSPGLDAFIWAAWGVLALCAVLFLRRYAANCPYMDEWDMVDGLFSGRRMLPWLWELHNEHRIPLPKLLYAVLFKLSSHDFRAGAYFNVLALAAFAFAVLRVAKRLGGRLHAADAFLPFALLNWGQWENLLWGFQVAFVLQVVASGLVLCLIVRNDGRLSWTTAFVIGISLICLSLCGANGLGLVLALCLWTGLVVLRAWRCADRWGRGPSALLASLHGTALFLVAAYFRGYVKPTGHPPCPGWREALVTCGQCMTMAFGPAADLYWPWGGWLIVALLATTVAMLLLAGWQRSGERVRALGLLLFLMGTAVTAAGIGWGRSGLGPTAGVASRYQTLMVPLLVAAYFTCQLYGGRALGPCIRVAMFGVALMLFPQNMKDGLLEGRLMCEARKHLVRDLHAGMPRAMVVDANVPGVFPEKTYLDRCLQHLHKAKVGAFASLRDEPVSEAKLEMRPAAVNDMTWEDGEGYGRGKQSALEFVLAQPTFVYGIRLKCACEWGSWEKAAGRLFWSNGDATTMPVDGDRMRNFGITRTGSEVTIWVNDTLDRFWIAPHLTPFEFHLSDLTLLLPGPLTTPNMDTRTVALPRPEITGVALKAGVEDKTRLP